jgi:hypothetical protein
VWDHTVKLNGTDGSLKAEAAHRAQEANAIVRFWSAETAIPPGAECTGASGKEVRSSWRDQSVHFGQSTMALSRQDLAVAVSKAFSHAGTFTHQY